MPLLSLFVQVVGRGTCDAYLVRLRGSCMPLLVAPEQLVPWRTAAGWSRRTRRRWATARLGLRRSRFQHVPYVFVSSDWEGAGPPRSAWPELCTPLPLRRPPGVAAPGRDRLCARAACSGSGSGSGGIGGTRRAVVGGAPRPGLRQRAAQVAAAVDVLAAAAAAAATQPGAAALGQPHGLQELALAAEAEERCTQQEGQQAVEAYLEAAAAVASAPLQYAASGEVPVDVMRRLVGDVNVAMLTAHSKAGGGQADRLREVDGVAQAGVQRTAEFWEAAVCQRCGNQLVGGETDCRECGASDAGCDTDLDSDEDLDQPCLACPPALAEASLWQQRRRRQRLLQRSGQRDSWLRQQQRRWHRQQRRRQRVQQRRGQRDSWLQQQQRSRQLQRPPPCPTCPRQLRRQLRARCRPAHPWMISCMTHQSPCRRGSASMG